MTTALYFEDTANAAGIKVPANAQAKWPEGGASAQVSLTAGTCTVGLEVSNINGTFDELLEFTLPVPAGEAGAGAMFDTASVPAHYRKYRWNVKAIAGGGTVTLGLAGIGV